MGVKSRSTLILRASCWALAASAIAGVQAANPKEIFQFQLMHQEQRMQSLDMEAQHAVRDKPPTQPIHRSILSHRKRTILREQHDNGESKKDNIANQSRNDGSLRVAKDRRRTTESEEASENGSSEPQDDQSSSTEPMSPLLTSERWVKIHEEVGQNSFNFVPESRRAASSVVFTYAHDKDRLLMDQTDEIGGKGGEEHNSTDVLVKGTEIDAGNDVVLDNATASTIEKTDTGNDNLSANATESIVKEGDYQGAMSEIASSTEALEQGDASEIDVNSSTISPTETTAEKEASSSDSEHGHDHESTANPGEEYMIISGGYTDHDWKSFPVYAFPISSSVRTQSGQWIDLSPSSVGGNTDETKCNEEDGASAREQLYQEAKYLDTDADNDDPWEHAQHCTPSGRMGHQSVVHNGKLYVFGGLIYDEEQSSGSKKESFRLEDVPFVYRLDLNEMFEARRAESQGNRLMEKVTKGWQRIIPRVKPFPTTAGMSSTSAAQVLLTSINRGEMQGGLWSSESTGGHDKFVMYGGLRIARSEYEGYGHNPSKFVKGESTFGSSQMHSHKIVELPLGDVWAYDLVLDSWEKMTNNYGRPVKFDVDTSVADNNGEVQEETSAKNKDPSDDDWWYDGDISSFPRPRTAHAATVVGNELVIHGGMGWNEHTNDWDGSTDWTTLDDMWVLDLSTREWTRRWLFPLLVRSYHSLVGWSVEENMMGWGKEFDNYTSWEGPVVAAFGGYTTGVDVFSGEELAYVFDDLLVSYPPSPSTNNPLEESPSPWLKVSMNSLADGDELISTRYEHSAVLSEEGVLVVWGGSFQDTKDVKGVWMINIAGKDSAVKLSMAEEDSIYKDYERTITALHTIVLMLMFMSISLTLLLGLTQRYQELVQHANDDAAVAAGITFAAQDFGNDTQPPHRGNGLHPEIIDTIPQKIYSASDNAGSGGNEGGDNDCCPICLLEYAEGDELRVLPCEHFMHKQCLDAWLGNNPSCPSCRYSLSELVDDRPMMQLRTLRSRLSNNPALARFLGHDSHDVVDGGIEMTAGASDGTVIDLRYVSSLALSEEDTDEIVREEGQQQGSHAQDPPLHTAMEEMSSWRSRRRQLQQDRRRSGLTSLRENVSRIRRNQRRRSRIPMADLDEE